MTALKTATGNGVTNYLYAKAAALKIPLSGVFELSPVCNFSCRMCYVRKTPQEVRSSPRGILNLEDWRSIARQAVEAGMLDLLLTGGEPLLWPDFWTLYEELTDMGLQVSVNTNGSLIDGTVVEKFKRKPPQRVNITLYGASDETYYRLCGVRGVFDRVDRGIRALQDAGITVKLNCSLTPENCGDLERIVAYGRDRGTGVAVAAYMFPPVRRDESLVGVNERFSPEDSALWQMRYQYLDWGPEKYGRFLEALASGCAQPLGLDQSCIDPVDGQVRCRAGKASFWISWDGWLMPCGMMPEPRQDLKTMPFSEGWRRTVADTQALRLSGVCEQCPSRDVCHPCAAVARAETGSTEGIPLYKCRATEQMLCIARQTLGAGTAPGESSSK